MKATVDAELICDDTNLAQFGQLRSYNEIAEMAGARSLAAMKIRAWEAAPRLLRLEGGKDMKRAMQDERGGEAGDDARGWPRVVLTVGKVLGLQGAPATAARIFASTVKNKLSSQGCGCH